MGKRQWSAECPEEPEENVKELRAALERAGIVPPTVGTGAR